MKRLLFICFSLLVIAPATYAQSDDVYFNSSDAQQQAKKEAKRQKAAEEARKQQQEQDKYDDANGKQDGDTYSSSGAEYEDNGNGDNTNYGRSYVNDDYADYEDGNYYARNINRFNYPYSSLGYYSPYYDPYWYNPYWSDPYWGWSAWSGPRFGVSFGGGPYWSSYWSWYSWYGYPGFYSAWNYPYYAGGYYGSYYNNYWNGYSAGLYGGNERYNGRSVAYGPRYSLNAVNNMNGVRPGVGFTSTVNNNASNGNIRPPHYRPANTNGNIGDNPRNANDNKLLRRN